MLDLVSALKKFNRKERYWLLRNIVGEKIEQLDPVFISSFEKNTGLIVPEDAWWAMDYHFDWLSGALHLLDGGGEDQPIDNSELKLIHGTQEDIDLIIAFGNTIILVEAKGDTSWTNKQLNRKIEDRLIPIFGENNENHPELNLFFVLMSPASSKGLMRGEKLNPVAWPEWMINKETKGFMYQPMCMPIEASRVMRWNKDADKQDKDGKHWVVTKKVTAHQHTLACPNQN